MKSSDEMFDRKTVTATLLKTKDKETKLGDAAEAAVEYKQTHPEEYVLFEHGGSPVAVELFSTSRSLTSASLDQHNASIARREGRDPRRGPLNSGR
jgi:hypothetical protein